MHRERVEAVNAERLKLWSRHLADEGAMAVALIGIAHGSGRSGTPVLCTLEDAMTDFDLAGLLRACAAGLELHPED
jgi:hypothetical protein